MPNHKATWKRLRQDKVRRARNVNEKSRLRTAIKKLRTLAEQGENEAALQELPKTFSLIDKAGKRRTIHPRTADRNKSRLKKMLDKVDETKKES